jgi:hypothetical protein
MFAPAYVGRERRGEAPSTVCLFLSSSPLFGLRNESAMNQTPVSLREGRERTVTRAWSFGPFLYRGAWAPHIPDFLCSFGGGPYTSWPFL